MLHVFIVIALDPKTGENVIFGLNAEKTPKMLYEMLEYMSSLQGENPHVEDCILLQSLVDKYACRIISISLEFDAYISLRKRQMGFTCYFSSLIGNYIIEWPSGLLLNPFNIGQYITRKTFFIKLNQGVCDASK